MKKVVALLLAMLMVFALVACGGEKESEKNGVTHTFYVFQNIEGLTTKEVPWAEGKSTTYPGYKLSDVVAKVGATAPEDSAICWFVAGTDKYASNVEWSKVKGELYVATEDTAGKGRTPITCGTANDTGSMPFNCELIVIGDSAFFFLDVAGSTVGKFSGWMSYMKDADIAFDDAENYTFNMKDGTTKTVAKADVDTVALKDVKSITAK